MKKLFAAALLLLAAAPSRPAPGGEAFDVWSGSDGAEVNMPCPARIPKTFIADVGQSTLRIVRGDACRIQSHPVASGVTHEAALEAYSGSLTVLDPDASNEETMTLTVPTLLGGAVDANLTITLPVGPAVVVKALDREVVLDNLVVPRLSVVARGGAVTLSNVANGGASDVATAGGRVTARGQLESLGKISVSITGSGRRSGRAPARPTTHGTMRLSTRDGDVILRR